MNPDKVDLRDAPVHVVLIDSRGTITGIQNHAGSQARDSNPLIKRYTVGASYFDYCSDDASRADVQSLLKRKRTITSFVTSSSEPEAKHVIVVLGVPVSPDVGTGAVLMHVDISAWAHQESQNDPWLNPVTLNPALVQDTFSKAFATQLAEQQHTYRAHPDIESLSPRQREVLLLVAAGKTNLEISEELSCSLNTVKRHVTAVLQKLHLPNRTRAANLANQMNLLSTPPRRR